jgi:hypothetical protein
MLIGVVVVDGIYTKKKHEIIVDTLNEKKFRK